MLAQSASLISWTQRTLPQARNIMFSWNAHDEFEMPGHIRLMERLLAETQTVCEIIGDPRQPAEHHVCIKRISKAPSDCAVLLANDAASQTLASISFASVRALLPILQISRWFDCPAILRLERI